MIEAFAALDARGRDDGCEVGDDCSEVAGAALCAVLSGANKVSEGGNCLIGYGHPDGHPRSFQYPGRRLRCMTASTHTTSAVSR